MKKHFSKVLSLALTLLLAVSLFPVAAFGAAVVDSGECGPHLTWELDRAGTLTVSGVGQMVAPSAWTQAYRKDIKEVILKTGVTTVAANAFYDCLNLEKVSFPSSLEQIGRYAFYRCVSLKEAVIPSNVSFIGDYTFLGCTALSKLKLPVALSSISDYTFMSCVNLTELDIPAGVDSIGSAAFAECRRLRSVAFPQGLRILKISAFSNCEGLRQIRISPALNDIKMYAFSGCRNLTDVYYTGTETEWKNALIDPSNTYLLNAKMHYNWKGALPELPLPGDPDGDGAVSPADARMTLRACVGLDGTVKPGTKAFLAADADHDGTLTPADARLILRASVGLEFLY